MKWAVVIEKSADGFGGYVPDVPGIGVVGDSPEEVRRLLAEAIELYLEEAAGDGPALEPQAAVDYVETHA